MADNCFDTKLLKYSGTGQDARILPALSGKYVGVDERTTADLVLFAKKYGAYLNYYELTNKIAGTWENLMSADVSVAIADIADWPTKNYNPFLKGVNENIATVISDTEAKKYFKTIFDFIFSIASALDKSLNRLPADLSFSKFLSVAITSNLVLPLNVLADHYGNFKSSLIDVGSTFVDPMMPVSNVVLSQNFDLHNLTPIWNTPASAPITLSGNVRNDINHIITHNLFTAPLNGFINGVINLVGKASIYLEETLQKYPEHSPHYALYLTFLRLFRFAQNHLNEYTGNHLDFYYKEVLRLTNRLAQPDFVHLVFELQKNVDAHLLTQGTLFKAGKDDKNNDLFYALTDNVVIQKASVQTLKALYLQKKGGAGVLYASPTADSEDGKGGKLLSVDKSWYLFGNPAKIAPANIGFAIASNILFLNEGKRTVTITFQCNSVAGITVKDLSGIFTIQLTGKKNWFTVDSYTPTISGDSFSLKMELNGDAPPVIPYSQKTHGGTFTTNLPMVQALVKDYKSYQKIKAAKILNISIEVSAAVKNLNLQNDDGRIDPAKPFKPFGEFPGLGASFIIGSKEIFQKSLTALTIHFDWQQAPATNVNADAVALNAGEWSIPFDSSIALGNSSNSLSGLTNIKPADADFTVNDEYNISSVSGFIKLNYKGTKDSLSAYLDKVKAAISQTSVTLKKNGTDVTGFTINTPAIQGPPAPPLAKSLSIDYTATETITFSENTAGAFSDRKNFYYHLEPFGFRELHPFSTDNALSFLPVFDLDKGVANDNGGELWIGLNSALPGQTFSILFQVSEGSSNPLKNMTKVDWYYLSENNWIQFDHLLINDSTNNFTRSGIVIITVPDDATTANARADTGLIWVKAVVDHDTDAVCKLVAVKTNGAKATFVQDKAKNIEFTKPLLSAIISKSAIADAAIKKTEQPYPSFDGQVRETDKGFYIRVSERLRHKHRGIAQWDYERLVLQNFPQIHKVKCLNHTGFIKHDKTNILKYSELLPGHVMVITVPDVTNITTADLLLPYTSIGLLTRIQQYVQSFISPFVKLHVCNPKFEEVQFDFKVSFHPNYDPIFYRNLLIDEIERFLTPWANKSGKDIEFGGKIEKSVVLNFVEERPYVDFVTCFKMNHIISREGSIITKALYDVEEAVASTARSVLVSFYDTELKQKHIINSPANCDCNA